MEKEFYKDFFLFDFFSTCLFIIKSPILFFQEVLNHDYRKKSKPMAFLVLSLSFFSIVTLWTGNILNQSTWADINFDKFSEKEIVVFFTEFSLNSSDIKDINIQRFHETQDPCGSDSLISRKIKKIVGSCELEDIAKYFSNKKENELSSKLYEMSIEASENSQKYDFVLFMIIPIILAVFSFFFHGFLNKDNAISFSQSKSVMAYYFGFNMMFVAPIIGYVTLNLDSLNHPLPFSISETILLISISLVGIYTWYMAIYIIGKKIYNASIIRSFFSMFMAFIVLDIIIFIFQKIMIYILTKMA